MQAVPAVSVAPFYTGGGRFRVWLEYVRTVSLSREELESAYSFHDHLLTHLHNKDDAAASASPPKLGGGAQERATQPEEARIKRYALVPRTGPAHSSGGDGCEVDWERCRAFLGLVATAGQKRRRDTGSVRGREEAYKYRKGEVFQRMLMKTHGGRASAFLLLGQCAAGVTPRRLFEDQNPKFRAKHRDDWRAYYKSKGVEELDGEQRMVRCVAVSAQDCWEHESSRSAGRLASACKAEGKSSVSVDPAADISQYAASDVAPELLIEHPLMLSAVMLPSLLVAIEADARALDVGRAALEGSGCNAAECAEAEHLLAAMTAPSVGVCCYGSSSGAPACRRYAAAQAEAEASGGQAVWALNYERLETVGYGVVKALLCAELFLRRPPLSPLAMTELYKARAAEGEREAGWLGECALRAGLHRFLNTHRPSHSRWTRARHAELRRDVSLDVLARALKALLAAVFLGAAPDSAATAAPTLAAARWLHLLPAEEPAALALQAFVLRGRGGQATGREPGAEAGLSAPEGKIVEMVERAIGYKFKDARLLLQALTPKSCSAAHNYERLEFLGDGVLEAVAGRGVFRANRLDDRGQLTVKRVAIISHAGLSAAAVRNELHRALLDSERDAATLTGEQRRQLLGYLAGAFPREAERYGYEGPREAEAPKVLSDVLEAVLAALMVEGGLDMASEIGWRMLSRTAASESPAG